MNTNITPDVFASYTAAAIAKSGFRLGDEIKINKIGNFILSEAQEDFVKGAPTKSKVRWSGTGFTTTGSDANHATKPKITVTDAGATVAAGALAGLRLTIMDVGATPDLDVEMRIKTNTAGASGSAMTIYLESPLAAEVTTGISLYAWDPDYVELGDLDEDSQCNGVAPCVVDMSEAPFFWRQGDGYTYCKMSDGATSAIKLAIRVSDTAGSFKLATLTGNAQDYDQIVGFVVQPATVNDGLALVKLNRLS